MTDDSRLRRISTVQGGGALNATAYATIGWLTLWHCSCGAKAIDGMHACINGDWLYRLAPGAGTEGGEAE